MGGDAGIGADGDIADIQSSDFRRNLAETVLLLQQVSHGQQHSLPIRGGANPFFIPDQKRKAQLFFQRVDQLAHAGGGLVEKLPVSTDATNALYLEFSIPHPPSILRIT